MKKDSPSSTAILIAKSIVFTSGDRRFKSILSKEVIDLSKAFLCPQMKPWRISLLEKLGRYAIARWVVDAMQYFSVPGMVSHYIIRKRRLEDIVKKTLSESTNLQQLVIIGAGLDTLGTRIAKNCKNLKVFEIDHPATSRLKQRSFEEGHVECPSSMSFHSFEVAGSTFPLFLKSIHDFSFDKKTLFIAEGVFMYLSMDDIKDTLNVMNEFSDRHASFVFTYMLPSEIDGRPAFKGQNRWADRWLGLKSEPFIWGASKEKMEDFIMQLGFDVFEHTDAEDLRRTYLRSSFERGIFSASGENILWVRK